MSRSRFSRAIGAPSDPPVRAFACGRAGDGPRRVEGDPPGAFPQGGRARRNASAGVIAQRLPGTRVQARPFGVRHLAEVPRKPALRVVGPREEEVDTRAWSANSLRWRPRPRPRSSCRASAPFDALSTRTPRPRCGPRPRSCLPVTDPRLRLHQRRTLGDEARDVAPARVGPALPVRPLSPAAQMPPEPATGPAVGVEDPLTSDGPPSGGDRTAPGSNPPPCATDRASSCAGPTRPRCVSPCPWR